MSSIPQSCSREVWRSITNPKAINRYIMVDLARLRKITLSRRTSVSPRVYRSVKACGGWCDPIPAWENRCLRKCSRTGKKPAQIVEDNGLKQIDNADEILTMVQQIIKDNPKPVADYKGGNARQ